MKISFKTIQFLLSSAILIISTQHADAAPPTINSTNQTVAYCPDYFNDKWNVRLDMSDAAHGVLNNIPTLQVGQVDALNYSNGILSFNSTGVAPAVVFLQYNVGGSLPVGTRYGTYNRIDSSYYKLFNIRMYASKATSAQLFWRHSLTRFASTNFAVQKGWHTYSIDLSTATIALSSGSNTGWTQDAPEGLELLPTNEAGVNIQFDWMQLTPLSSGCSNFSVNYTSTAGGTSDTTTVILDNDTDITNGILDSTSATSAGTSGASFTTEKLFPATYKAYAFRSSDWATTKLFNAFDFSEADCNDVKPASFYQMTGACGVSGNLSATTTGGDTSFFLNIPNGSTIDGTKYKYLTVDINYTGIANDGSDFLQVYLLNTAGNAFVINSPLTSSVFLGHNKLDFLIPAPSGPIGQVRIDPVNHSGINFVVNYVSFSEGAYTAAEPSLAISAQTPNVTIQDLNLSIVQPDKKGGHDFFQEVLGNALNMDSASDLSPIFNVQDAYLYPANTFPDLPNVNPTPQVGNFMFFRNIPYNGDANYQILLSNGSFDPSRYVNVCYRAWNAIEQPSLYNSVARILWADPAFPNSPNGYRDGDDIIMNRGAAEYCMDMTDINEAAIECNDGLYCPPKTTNPWTSIGAANGKISFLRIDLNENTEGPSAQYYSVFDYINVRTDHETPSNFAIVVNASTSNQVNLYYNTVKSISGGTLIGSLAASRNTNTYIWNASALPSGRYYVFAEVSSGGNTTYALSSGRVSVSPSFSLDATAPIISCDRPTSSVQFDTEFQVAGYALDETRLATVEVKIDGNYLTSITPSLFSKEAHDLYPNYADANYPRFNQKIAINPSSVGYGSHTVTLTAIDTTGNQATCSISGVQRVMGGNTTDLTYTPPNDAPVAIPTAVPTPTATPIPTATSIPLIPNTTKIASARHTAAGVASIKVSGISNAHKGCTLSLQSGSISRSTKQVLVRAAVSANDIKKKAMTFVKNGVKVAAKGPSKLYFSTVLSCPRVSAESSEGSMKLVKTKSGSTSAAAVLKVLKGLKKS